MSSRNKAIFAVILGSFLGSAIGSFGKIGLKQMPPLTFSFLRFVIASVLLAIFFKRNFFQTLKQLKKLILISLLATFNIILYIFGLKLTTATISQFLYVGTPLLTWILLFILLGSG